MGLFYRNTIAISSSHPLRTWLRAVHALEPGTAYDIAPAQAIREEPCGAVWALSAIPGVARRRIIEAAVSYDHRAAPNPYFADPNE
jgi:hypothetical protein